MAQCVGELKADARSSMGLAAWPNLVYIDVRGLSGLSGAA